MTGTKCPECRNESIYYKFNWGAPKDYEIEAICYSCKWRGWLRNGILVGMTIGAAMIAVALVNIK